MQITERQIIECAKKLLKNTTIKCLRTDLEELILNGNNMEDDDIYKVVKRICEDGYDISEFGLGEIPHPCVYCFENRDESKLFDVYLDHLNGSMEEVTVGFVNSNSNTEDAKSIEEAIEKYIDLSPECS